jgi:hypothetical protein
VIAYGPAPLTQPKLDRASSNKQNHQAAQMIAELVNAQFGAKLTNLQVQECSQSRRNP